MANKTVRVHKAKLRRLSIALLCAAFGFFLAACDADLTEYVPVCHSADFDRGDAVLGCEGRAHLDGVTVFEVPADATHIETTLTYNNWVGSSANLYFFPVDDEQGTIDGVPPIAPGVDASDPNCCDEWRNRRIARHGFAHLYSQSPGSVQTYALTPGTEFLSFAYDGHFPSHGFTPFWFTNFGKMDQLLVFDAPGGKIQLAWERTPDYLQAYNGDRNTFNDDVWEFRFLDADGKSVEAMPVSSDPWGEPVRPEPAPIELPTQFGITFSDADDPILSPLGGANINHFAHTSVLSNNGGSIVIAQGTSSLVGDFPNHQDSNPPQAMIRVANATDADVLTPRARDFWIAAKFNLDDDNTGGGTDNGNNLIQRGRGGDGTEHQIKIEIDKTGGFAGQFQNLTPICVMRASLDNVKIEGNEIDTERDYKIQCERTGETVRLKVWTLGPDGFEDELVTDISRFGNIGTFQFSRRIPMSIGGKLTHKGDKIETDDSDQFNGTVDEVEFVILE